MELKLKAQCVEKFENHMSELGPWMHSYKFAENIFTGYYKNEGVGKNLTFVNSKSPDSDIKKLKEAYHLRKEHVIRNFFTKIINNISLSQEQRRYSTVLDISSATGKKALWAVDEGFGSVIASEIRKHQCDQIRLILDCIENEKYKEAITVNHDPISADSKEFPKTYINAKKPDVAFSFGLLYHLSNPVQHIINIHSITKKFAVIYTYTHYTPGGKKLWRLETEDADWITKATSSISWTPHFLEVPHLCKQAGFKQVKTIYPDMFEKNFSYFNEDTKSTQMKIICSILAFGIFKKRIGMMKNHDFSYYRYVNLNPNYFAYVCEK